MKLKSLRRYDVPGYHQVRIARQTLKMPDAMARIMGGPTKAEARDILRRYGFKRNPAWNRRHFSGKSPAQIEKAMRAARLPSTGMLAYAFGYWAANHRNKKVAMDVMRRLGYTSFNYPLGRGIRKARNPIWRKDFASAKKQAQANADYFVEPFVVFRDTSNNLRVERAKGAGTVALRDGLIFQPNAAKIRRAVGGADLYGYGHRVNPVKPGTREIRQFLGNTLLTIFLDKTRRVKVYYGWHSDTPIRQFDGSIVYDRPDMLPHSVKTIVRKFFDAQRVPAKNDHYRPKHSNPQRFWAGHKKYGKTMFQAMAARGRMRRTKWAGYQHRRAANPG